MFALVTPQAKRLDSVLEDATKAPFSYPEVGATRTEMPTGYHHDEAIVELGTGRSAFERCARLIDSFGLQTGSQFTVHPAGCRVADNTTALVVAYIPPLHMIAPVRVVYRIVEPNRHGFAYGTLTGHPESGEEYFGISIDSNDVVRSEIRAFSKAQSKLAVAAGPFTRFQQKAALRTYVNVLRNAALATDD